MPDTLSQKYKEMFEQVSNFARNKQFDQINDLLRNSPTDEHECCEISMGLLRYTYSLKNKLVEWNPAFRRLSKLCNEVYGDEKSKSMLRGLSEEPFVPMFKESKQFYNNINVWRTRRCRK